MSRHPNFIYMLNPKDTGITTRTSIMRTVLMANSNLNESVANKTGKTDKSSSAAAICAIIYKKFAYEFPSIAITLGRGHSFDKPTSIRQYFELPFQDHSRLSCQKLTLFFSNKFYLYLLK